MKKPFMALLGLVAYTSIALAQTSQNSELTLFQKPTVNRTQIVFVYAGDLWIAPREGGDAKPLTSGVGVETDPSFSPDGTRIAFTGQYDGNTDVYVIPTTGGVPKRLTYHPGPDLAVGWSPDGKRILFSSARNSYRNFIRLYSISADGGGLPEQLPLPMAERGAYSPDGSRIVYEPLSQWQPEWKRYRGGQMDYLWIAQLSDSSIEKLPREKANDRSPMWIGDRVYFLSDRDGKYTLYTYDTKSKKVEQLIRNDGMDIKTASADLATGTIAYEQFGVINLYDVKSRKSQKVNLRVSGDLINVRPRYEKVGNRIFNARISPTGARAVFEARGEILTVPAEKGDPRNLTRTTGVVERDPAWSPDGRWISYFSDESGEYALHIRDQKGEGEVKKIKLEPTFYLSPAWSPDSKKISFTDKRNNLWYVDIEKGAPVKIDRNPDGLRDDVLDVDWSPDSKWLTYGKHLENHLRGIFLYSLESGKITQVTDGMSDARYPLFDKNGELLYFTASTNLGPAFSFAEMSNYPFQSSRSVYAVVLRNDKPSPVAPQSDEEKIAEEKKEGDAAKPAEKPAEKPDAKDVEKKPDQPKPPAKKEPEPTRIDLEGLGQRIVALPIPSRNYIGTAKGKTGILFLLEAAPQGAGEPGGPPGFLVQKFDLEKRKVDKVGEGVTAFELSANGEKVLMRQGFTNWVISNVAALGGPPAPPGSPAAPQMLKTADMEVYVDPKVEWRQMYNEAWRNERDFFYDPNLHGLDLDKMKKMYEPYVAQIAHRNDLNYLLTEMLNQLTIGHMFIGGGDIPNPKFVPGGLLGCDFTIENGRYRFAKVYNGENWNPNLRAPLTQPGVNVKAGEYLLAVNGRNLTANDNVYQFFESTANKQVVIKIGPNPDGSASREVTVVPTPNETALRNLDWIEGNRRKVDQASSGKLAYVYVPDTGGGGYTSFNRYFFSQTHKQGAVIDERFNQGGSLADYIVESLSRPLLNFIYFREGRSIPTPAGAIYGPKAMLVNEMAGSGGDALPWYFRKMKIGPTIGKRTWGGLVASFRPPPLMDGGFHTAPDAAIYGLTGDWEVENVGTPADIEVEFDPALWRQGRDPQLEKAIEYLMEELKKNPPTEHKLPPFPNYHKTTTASSGN
jgi:tricorn protease